MRYLGGKARIAKPIAAIVDAVAERLGATVLEPFCGALNVTAALRSPRVATDACKPLITLYRALREGWTPPEVVDREMYDRVKASKDPDDPLTAFVGFGCSFGGKWFAGFDAGHRPSCRGEAAAEAARSIVRKLALVVDVPVRHADYRDHRPEAGVVYCDPPYAGTTGYNGVGAFDSEQFWSTTRTWSRKNVVLVSEYMAPADFVPVWEASVVRAVDTATHKQARTFERLFVHESHADLVKPPASAEAP
jgi:DNA adenine methylase